MLARGAIAAESTIAGDELLQSARLWELRQRGDLARLALEKLVTARADSAEALLESGELNLRMSDFAAADEVLRRLEQRFAKSAATRSMGLQYRLATRDRLQWLAVQRLAQLDQGEKVRRELRRLFPDGAPEGSIAIEYYRLLAVTPGGRDEAARLARARCQASERSALSECASEHSAAGNASCCEQATSTEAAFQQCHSAVHQPRGTRGGR